MPDDLSDDYIFNEIKLYANRSDDLKAAESVKIFPSEMVAMQKIGNPFQLYS